MCVYSSNIRPSHATMNHVLNDEPKKISEIVENREKNLKIERKKD